MHLDSFQRIVVDPASISIIRYTASRPYAITVNSSTVDLGAVVPRRRRQEDPALGRTRQTDARTGCRGGGTRQLRMRAGRPPMWGAMIGFGSTTPYERREGDAPA